MAVIVEDFITFRPASNGFPAGPFDLEEIEYSFSEDVFTLLLRLGYVYDFYLLKFIAAESVSWELWHLDSAVMHVDEMILAKNPTFACKEWVSPCAIPLSLIIGNTEVKGTAARLRIRAQEDPFSFEVEFRLPNISVALGADGWRTIDQPSDL